MPSWLQHTLETLSATPALQAIVAGLCTLVFEDPTTVGCALLVAEGHMAFLTALIGLTCGITLGDFGLYTIGRLVGPRTVTWGWLSQERLDRAKSWFDRNLILAVLISRFLPGTRMPTFVGAGIFQASAWRFLATALFASLVWTLFLLCAVVKLGETMLPLLGNLKWPVVAVFILVLVLVQRRASKKLGDAPDSHAAPVSSAFEFWPPFLFYIPVGFYYSWLTLRHLSFTLPTAVNPSIYSGGMIRESKSQILSLVPEPMRHWFAAHVFYMRPGADIPLDEVVREALAAAETVGIGFPLVAKPDLGQRGAGVQKLSDVSDLRNYIQDFPPDTPLILQECVDFPREAGVLYYRYPHEVQGRIMSITMKEFPSVVGDGTRSLRELITSDPRAKLVQHVYLRRHAEVLDRVLAEGEEFRLVFAGNHAQGAVFRDGTGLATPALLQRIQDIASAIPEFYFGRFDIRFTDLNAFLRGEEFRVVEINGAGAEATHIWDPAMTLTKAYQSLFIQFRVLFEIGAENRRRGYRTLGPIQLLRDCWTYRQTSRAYPISH